jgi:hypothetical protein
VSLDLVSAVVFLAPGFLAFKVLDVLGAQRKRSEWEWTTWSVIASLPINAGAAFVRGFVPVPMQGPAPDGWQVAIALLLGIAVGAVLAYLWRRVGRSGGARTSLLRRELNDYAWDQAFEDASHFGRAIEVETATGERYRGKLRYSGRDAAESAGWFYLYWPDRRESEKGWKRYRHTHGLILHRDQIKAVRVYLSPVEDAQEAAELVTSPTAAR